MYAIKCVSRFGTEPSFKDILTGEIAQKARQQEGRTELEAQLIALEKEFRGEIQLT